MKDSREREPAYAKKETEQFTFDYEPIRGYPELRWTGKRPFRGTSYYPAQLKESHGDTVDGWRNKLYWGDNLQVMSHLLREYRGKVRLVYIDPPFDSKADYKKKIELRGKSASSDASVFEEKQYSDIWVNDEYLQFMYERFIVLRELLSEDGSLYVHMDPSRGHAIKLVLDEVFGATAFQREIIWRIGWISGYKSTAKNWIRNHDNVLYYAKGDSFIFNKEYIPYPESYVRRDGNKPEGAGYPIEDTWNCNEMDHLDSIQIMSFSGEKIGYPTQKNENLVSRIIKASSNPGDLVFDCFMGSGTTQAVAMKLGRRFLGADINLGAVQTTTKRLLGVAEELRAKPPRREEASSTPSLFSSSPLPSASSAPLREISPEYPLYTGFEVYTVNNYDFFRNELEAKRLIIEALELQELPGNMLWDGESDGWMVKILAVNRLATAADLEPVLGNLDYRAWEKRAKEHPDKSVEKIRFVCLGHDPELKGQFHEEMDKLGFKVEVEVLDILREKKELQFKRDSEAKLVLTKKKLEIRRFYPMNLLGKLSLEKTKVGDWRELVDSVYIDWNYDGAVFSPALCDITERDELVKGVYDVPEGAGTIRVRITDLLSESWEGNAGD